MTNAEADTDLIDMPPVRGRYTANAPLGEVGWFRAGGKADVLFKPADREDLANFLSRCPAHVPVMTLGVLSNTLVRDGGVRGVVIRLGRDFADVETRLGGFVMAGAAALDGNVALAAAKAGIAGLEYLAGVPGTIGGALRMNAGAYGSETKDVLMAAEALDRQGNPHHLTPAQMGMTYRHNAASEELIFTGAIFQGKLGEQAEIESHINAIKERRAETQPIRSRTGGSTFANPPPEQLASANLPPDTKTWQLIDQAGCRGLTVGGAQMSEMHCNFMINTGLATATDLENLGEEVKRRVYENCGIQLRWEIKRIGAFHKGPLQ
jgi:UDP-N-acetylmuramate dehydrogenase